MKKIIRSDTICCKHSALGIDVSIVGVSQQPENQSFHFRENFSQKSSSQFAVDKHAFLSKCWFKMNMIIRSILNFIYKLQT